MKDPILRGIDFQSKELGDQLRFCHPLVSFEDSPELLYYARSLAWAPKRTADDQSLLLIDTDQLDRFTLIDLTLQLPIRPNEGVVLVGCSFAQALKSIEIILSDVDSITFVNMPGTAHSLGVASTSTYLAFAQQLQKQAGSIFDKDLRSSPPSGLSDRGQAALFLLRKNGVARPTDMVMRELAAAYRSRAVEAYRRLLLRYSITLNEAEEVLQEKLLTYIRRLGLKPTQLAMVGANPPIFSPLVASQKQGVKSSKQRVVMIWTRHGEEFQGQNHNLARTSDRAVLEMKYSNECLRKYTNRVGRDFSSNVWNRAAGSPVYSKDPFRHTQDATLFKSTAHRQLFVSRSTVRNANSLYAIATPNDRSQSHKTAAQQQAYLSTYKLDRVSNTNPEGPTP